MKFSHLAAVLLALTLAACGGGGGSSSTSTSSGSSTSTTTTMSSAATVVSISATPTATTSGQVITLTWNVANPTTSSCTASGAWNGSVATSGSQNVTAGDAGDASYTLTCGSVSNTATVTVSAPPPAAPTVSMSFASSSLTVGNSTTLSWSSANATSCTASGDWVGTYPTSGSQTIAPTSAGSYTYNMTCTGSGGSATASSTLSVAAATSNSVKITVDSGPSGVSGVINVPYVSVTVCIPGTTTCQTIDHVLLDTGSYGLRLLASQLSSSLALPAVTTSSGAAAGECGKFISGYTWGSVRQADVKMADEVASGISVQVIGDTDSAYSTTPSTCSSAGSNLGTLSAIGAKGILGVGMFKQDCGSSCAASAISGVYYACSSSGSCSASAMPLAKQISNPVTSFSVNNNGVMINLPAVSTSGATSVSGTLYFGVNTQSNNTISSETIYKANSSGDFTTTYNGKAYTASFIDSGSNGYFFTDSSIQKCSGNDFYCPSSTLSLSAVNSAADGSASATVSFNVVNIVGLNSSVNAAHVGGTVGSSSSSSNYFDWGLPFYYGRKVYLVMENNTVSSTTGPFWAY